MRTLFINNYYSKIGGSEAIMAGTAELLSKNGHEVAFFATNKKPFINDECEYIKYFPEYINYKSISKIKAPLYVAKSIYNKEAEKKLDILIKETNPDVAHIHTISYFLTSSVIKACHKNNIPIIMTLHNPYLFCPSSRLMIKGKTYCKDIKCISGNPFPCIQNRCFDSNLIKSIISSMEYVYRNNKKLFDQINIFTVPSKSLLNIALKAGIPEEKVVLINNFTDDLYLNTSPDYSLGKYFLYVGRLSPEKGINYLIEAMSMLHEGIKLLIVGSGKEEEYLKNKTENLNLKNISFVPFQNRNELLNIYKDCIASILPSVGYETFGLSAIESLACGKPVIGSNMGGIPEVIDNNKNGIIVEPGNINMLANAIKFFNDNPEIATEMGKNGRKRVEELYSSEIYFKKMLEQYNLLVNIKR